MRSTALWTHDRSSSDNVRVFLRSMATKVPAWSMSTRPYWSITDFCPPRRSPSARFKSFIFTSAAFSSSRFCKTGRQLPISSPFSLPMKKFWIRVQWDNIKMFWINGFHWVKISLTLLPLNHASRDYSRIEIIAQQKLARYYSLNRAWKWVWVHKSKLQLLSKCDSITNRWNQMKHTLDRLRREMEVLKRLWLLRRLHRTISCFLCHNEISWQLVRPQKSNQNA